MTFSQVFSLRNVVLPMQSVDKDEAFEELVQRAVESIPSLDREAVLESLRGREEQMSTGIMHGIAVPHATCAGVSGIVGLIGVSKAGLDYEALDGSPVHLVFMLLSEEGRTEQHLHALSMLARILRSPGFLPEVLDQDTAKGVFDKICDIESDCGA